MRSCHKASGPLALALPSAGALLWLFACACPGACSAPVDTKVMVFDGGVGPQDAVSGDARARDSDVEDASSLDGAALADATATDAEDATDADDEADASDAADAGDSGIVVVDDAGADAGDVSPRVLVEDYSNPAMSTWICPDGTIVPTGTVSLHASHCLGIDGSSCPEEAGVAGPGDSTCANPAYNPFVVGGQCVVDFFACFGAAGVCTHDTLGDRFLWSNGAEQRQVRGVSGAVIEAQYRAPGSTAPCVVTTPNADGVTSDYVHP